MSRSLVRQLLLCHKHLVQCVMGTVVLSCLEVYSTRQLKFQLRGHSLHIAHSVQTNQFECNASALARRSQLHACEMVQQIDTLLLYHEAVASRSH